MVQLKIKKIQIIKRKERVIPCVNKDMARWTFLHIADGPIESIIKKRFDNVFHEWQNIFKLVFYLNVPVY